MAYVLLQKQVKQYYLDAMRHTSRFNLCKGYLAISELSVNQMQGAEKRGTENAWNAPKPSFAEFQVLYAELLK